MVTKYAKPGDHTKVFKTKDFELYHHTVLFFFLLSQSHFHQKCVGLVPFVNTSAHAITVKYDSVYYFVANSRLDDPIIHTN